jgi:hypothetical protein
MSAPVVKIRTGTPEWDSLTAWVDHHLKSYRMQLESETVSTDKVAGLRARISMLKALQKSNVVEEHSE